MHEIELNSKGLQQQFRELGTDANWLVKQGITA